MSDESKATDPALLQDAKNEFMAIFDRAIELHLATHREGMKHLFSTSSVCHLASVMYRLLGARRDSDAFLKLVSEWMERTRLVSPSRELILPSSVYKFNIRVSPNGSVQASSAEDPERRVVVEIFNTTWYIHLIQMTVTTCGP